MKILLKLEMYFYYGKINVRRYLQIIAIFFIYIQYSVDMATSKSHTFCYASMFGNLNHVLQLTLSLCHALPKGLDILQTKFVFVLRLGAKRSSKRLSDGILFSNIPTTPRCRRRAVD